jgi:hypothetical protein
MRRLPTNSPGNCTCATHQPCQYFSISGPLGPEQLHYDWIVADGPLEALHRFHAEALGSTRSGSMAGGWYFWTRTIARYVPALVHHQMPAQRHCRKRGRES